MTTAEQLEQWRGRPVVDADGQDLEATAANEQADVARREAEAAARAALPARD